MCLSTVDSKPRVTEGMGYKVMVRYPSRKSLHTPMMSSPSIPVGKWITDRNQERISNMYYTGYHIFLSKDVAENWIGGRDNGYAKREVRVVQFRNVTATGKRLTMLGAEEKSCPCVVAREIRIVPRKEELLYDI